HRTAQFNSVGEFLKLPKCWVHLRFALAILGVLTASVLAAAGGVAWVLGSFFLVAKLWSWTGALYSCIVLIAAPPLFLGASLVTMLLLVGFLGHTFRDSHREWLSRMAVWMGLFMLLWALSTAFSLLSHRVLLWFWLKFRALGISAIAGWLASTVGGLIAAKSP